MQRTSMMGLLLAATLVLGACGQSQSTVADSTEQRQRCLPRRVD